MMYKSRSILKKSISVLSVICLLLTYISFFSLIQDNTRVSAAELDSKIIVSMGDSYASGEGITPFYGQSEELKVKVKNQDWVAHRSEKSWAGQLTLPNVDGPMSEHRDENWYFVATSGATTYHMDHKFPKDYNKVVIMGNNIEGTTDVDPQTDVFDQLEREGKKADYVTLSLGGNDAHFADVIMDALIAGVLTPDYLVLKLNLIWQEFYKDGGIRDNLLATYRKIRDEAGEQAKIIVVGYPQLLDESGDYFWFSSEIAKIVNDAVSRFNKEIETLVNSCKAEGMRICFVSVEEGFEGHLAYSDDPYIRSIDLIPESEDLKTVGATSDYSMHPNSKGAEVYRRCVQTKIDSIEKDGGKSEWPTMSGSDERDIVLVLDTSGSMSGTPLQETKNASEGFIETVLKEDASIGIVTYDSNAFKLADFCMNETYLKNIIGSLSAGGGTNISDGLALAHEMLKSSGARKKIIVMMSDGEPNEGKLGDGLISYADEIREDGIYIYTLGFFSAIYDKTYAQSLMEGIANEGCHFEVDDPAQLVFFFGDIADLIKGTKYIYIRIACPVDVKVSFEDEVLSSRDNYSSQRVSFGTLTFEENETDPGDSPDNRIKILRLRQGAAYDVHIEGNGTGHMLYTIGFMDTEGNYSDMREFEEIEITADTKIDTVANNTRNSVLKIDNDGDGEYDETLTVEGKFGIEDEKEDKKEDDRLQKTVLIILIAAAAVFLLILVILGVRIIMNSAVIVKISQAKKEKKPEKVKKEKKGSSHVKKASSNVKKSSFTSPRVAAPKKAEAPSDAPVSTPDVFCGNCGKRKKEKEIFCPHCGSRNDK